MDITSASTLITAATVVVAVVLVAFVLSRFLRQDGYGYRPAPESHPDWGNRTTPSRPFSSSLY